MSNKIFSRQVKIANSLVDTARSLSTGKTIVVKGHIASKEEIEKNRRSKYEYIF